MLAALCLLLSTHLPLLSPHGEKAVVLLFARTDCPVSNRYAPDLQRLYEKFAPQGIDFRLVYPEHPRALDYDRDRGPIRGYPGGGSYAAFAFNVGYARAMLQAALTA